jgi:hypothetical protein
MGIWISTVVLVIVLAVIVRAELRSGRRSKIKLAKTNQQIDDLARTAFEQHREVFGRDATGTFPLVGTPDIAKK